MRTVVLLVALLTLAACTSNAPTAMLKPTRTPTPTSATAIPTFPSGRYTGPVPSTPAIDNPVDILRRTTCTISPGEKIGQPTILNDGGLGYFADCYWGREFEDETLTVWRYPSRAVLMQALAIHPPTRSDGVTHIMSDGPDGDWDAEVYAFTSPDSITGPTPAVIARQLGGTIS